MLGLFGRRKEKPITHAAGHGESELVYYCLKCQMQSLEIIIFPENNKDMDRKK